MRISFPTLAAVLALVVSAQAEPPTEKELADARARAALALVKSRTVEVYAAKRHVGYADAVALSKKTGKPIFVSVSADCSNVCGDLRPDFITCHEKTFAGDSKPRFILAVPSKEKGFIHVQWEKCPRPEDVKAEFNKYKVSLRSPDFDAAGDLLAMVALGTIALEADAIEWIDSPRVVCDANGCRVVNGVTYTRLPVADGPSVATAPTADAVAFAPRFPRLARLRGRFRQAAGFAPPVVRGSFVPVASAPVAVESTTSPQVVGGPLFDRFVVRPLLRDACRDALASGKLTTDQATMARRIVGERDIAELATTFTHERAKAKLAAPVGGPILDSLKAWIAANLPAILDALLKLLMGLI